VRVDVRIFVIPHENVGYYRAVMHRALRISSGGSACDRDCVSLGKADDLKCAP